MIAGGMVYGAYVAAVKAAEAVEVAKEATDRRDRVSEREGERGSWRKGRPRFRQNLHRGFASPSWPQNGRERHQIRWADQGGDAESCYADFGMFPMGYAMKSDENGQWRAGRGRMLASAGLLSVVNSSKRLCNGLHWQLLASDGKANQGSESSSFIPLCDFFNTPSAVDSAQYSRYYSSTGHKYWEITPSPSPIRQPAAAVFPAVAWELVSHSGAQATRCRVADN
jgi:hypothetical protein